MIHKVLLASERLRTIVASVWCFSRVPHYMVFIMILAREILSTDLTVERRVSNVRASLSVDYRSGRYVEHKPVSLQQKISGNILETYINFLFS